MNSFFDALDAGAGGAERRASKMGQKEPGAFIDRRAYELARSGQYADWLSIELALRREGLRQPGHLLLVYSEILQQELDEICTQTRRA